MSTDTLMIPRSPVGPPPGSPAIKNTKKVMTAAAAAKKEAKTAAATAKKEAKARETAANKQRKSAEVARKKVLTELNKNQKILRLAAEKEEKKQARIAARQARIAAQQAQRVAQREAVQAQRRADHERRLAEARAAYEERRAARLANEEAARNNPAIGEQADADLVQLLPRRVEEEQNARRERNARRNEETQNRQIRIMSKCFSDTTTDLRNASRTQQQLTCATTAFQTDECPICLEDLGETNCMTLRCGHKTCGDCILRHFQSVGGRKCPVCRDQYAVRVKGWIAPTLFNI